MSITGNLYALSLPELSGKKMPAPSDKPERGDGWTEERVELLKKLWLGGLSASQVAGELGGTTRNAVISKVHRIGLAGRERKSSANPRPRAPRAPSAERLASTFNPPYSARIPAPAAHMSREPEQELQEAVAPDMKPCTLLELDKNTCRWPVGDPTHPDFRYCGGKTVTDVPYCNYHMRIAYEPAVDRRRRRQDACADRA